jgi:hypothetical protein
LKSDLLAIRLSAPDLSTARSVTTSRPWPRKRAAGTQLRENVPHGCDKVTAKRLRAESARALLSRSMTRMRPVWSSQTRNRAYTRAPTRRRDRNAMDGALLPGTVVVVVTVVV